MKAPFYLSAIALTAGLSIAQEVPVEPAAEPVAVDSVAAKNVAADSVATAVAVDSVTAVEPVAAAEPAAEPVAEPVAEPADSVVAKNVAAEPVAEPIAEPVAEQPATVAEQSTVQLLPGTKLSGNLHGFLKADASPYLIEENVSIEKDNVLIIEPGVVLQFAPNAGLNVKGQLVLAGNKANKVVLTTADASGNSKWKGIFISSEAENEIRNAAISNAENGLVVENSNLSLQSAEVSKTSQRAVFAKNSKVSISDCSFEENAGVALHVSNYAVANVQRSTFKKNNVALLNAELAQTDVSASAFEENTFGILDKGNSKLVFSDTKVSKNQNGVASSEILDKSVTESIKDNNANFNKNPSAVIATLAADPEIPGVQSREIKPKESISDVVNNSIAANVGDTASKSISIIGNVMLGANYHHVMTRRNHSKEADIVGKDTIKTNQHYKNTFQVPGLGGEASAYLLMQLPNGGTLEFDANLTADSWNHFSPNPVSLTYTDSYNHATLGDFQKISGDIYMSSLPVFGADYTLSLLKNNVDQPLFEFNAFAGESQRSLVPGERQPDMYNVYVEDGSAQAQRTVAGGSFKWSPLRRFDAKFGALYADDAIKDPIIRKGTSKPNVTSEPLQESFTIFADGNWLFYPGDIELNGQVAMGRADTAEVFVERAINSVFQDAGVNVASYSSLRQLMVNESEIYRLTQDELEEIFGDNTTMTRGQMRDSLRTLVRKANATRKDAASSNDDDKVLGMKWSGQNLAIGASLFWNINKTTLSGHVKYVGENYYSAGSPDLLADTREFGGNLEQIINKFWALNFGYQINVENAAKDDNANIFGLGEGTTIGFGSASESWKMAHELDNDRTKYIQNISLANNIKVNDKVSVNVGYGLEYRTQYKPTRLHGVFSLSDEIYKDKWFAKRKGKETITIYNDGDSTVVDKSRWNEYMEMATEPYLASIFQERIFKHTWKGDVTLKAYKSVFKLGGVWTLRVDGSVFHNDSLMKKLDLSTETWSKMGYYFGGADYFEQTYPLSATTTLPALQNKIAVTPRFKSYERNDMSEAEITIDDELEIPLMNRFLILGANGTFRYLTTSWTQDGKDENETETDVLGNVKVRINHTNHLNSEWYLGTAMYYRPENLGNEYKDAFGGVRVNYVF